VGNSRYDFARQLSVLQALQVGTKTYAFYSLAAAEKNGSRAFPDCPSQ
jgi:hypothetical protein